MNSAIQNLLRYGNRKPSPTFWCKRCNIPLIKEKCEKCSKQGVIITKGSLRPVFKEELAILKKQSRLRSKWFSLPDLSFWAAKRNYFYNGEKVFSVKLTDGQFEITLHKKRNDPIPQRPLKPETIISRLRKANQSSLNRLEYQAIEFIEQAVKTFPARLPIVSFSGGKDSCVVSHLVRLALGTRIIHIFGDTTIEYPDTYKFIERFRKDNPSIPFLIANPNKDFFELAEEIGPPSRILRWCCTTHKTGPIGQIKASLNGEGTLAFIGSRRGESSKRSKYETITLDKKIMNEIASYPILSWSDTELWLYLLTRHIDISRSYLYGITRVGCLYCPFNGDWSSILLYKYNDKFKKWNDLLLNYAKKSKIQEPDIFATKGWKVRGGGMGYNSWLAVTDKSECKIEENTIKYNLHKKIDDNLLEYLKPIGRILRYADNKNFFFFDSKTNETLFILRVNKTENSIRIVFLSQKNRRLLIQRVEKQILRFQTCVMCGQCHNVCKVAAFSPIQGRSYKINENVCINCLECVRKTCPAQKSLKDYRRL